MISDALIIILTGWLLFYLYLHPHNKEYLYIGAVCINTVLTIGLFNIYNLYKPTFLNRRRFQLNKLVKLCFLSFFLLITLVFALKISDQFSRVWAFSWFMSILIALPYERLLFAKLIAKWSRAGYITNNTAIVFNTEQAALLKDKINNSKDPWLRLVGVFDDRSVCRSENFEELDTYGNMEDLYQLVQDNKIDDLIIALPWSAENRIERCLEKFEHLPVRVSVCPNLIGFKHKFRVPDHIGGVSLLSIYEKPISAWRYIIKTTMDYLLASIAIILLLPIFLIIAICIKIESKGPILFIQDRVGFSGKIFKAYKFRTMYVEHTDQNADQLVKPDDARVTKVGRLLRRWSLDELPQLFNVIMGTMSMVGRASHMRRMLKQMENIMSIKPTDILFDIK